MFWATGEGGRALNWAWRGEGFKQGGAGERKEKEGEVSHTACCRHCLSAAVRRGASAPSAMAGRCGLGQAAGRDRRVAGEEGWQELLSSRGDVTQIL